MVIHLDYNYGNYYQHNDLWVSLKMEAPVNHQILGYIILDTPIWWARAQGDKGHYY